MASEMDAHEKPEAFPIEVVDGNMEKASSLISSVDTVHNDEAMRVFAQDHGEDTWDPAEEKRLLRKLDWRLLPLLCATYVPFSAISPQLTNE
jgi:hypothetical protein